MAKLKKRADGRYAKQVTVGHRDGKPIKKTVYGKTLPELDRNYRALMELVDKGIILDEENLTFEELSDMWVTNEILGAVKHQTYTNLKSQLKNINKYIGNIKIKDLKTSHIEYMRADEIKLGKIDQYNKALGNIKTILDYGVRKNIAPRNVAHGLKRIKYSGKKEKRALTDQERHLLEVADFNDFEKCFINLILYTGLRKSEALALNIQDIDFKNRCITVNKTLVTSRGQEHILQDNTKTSSGMRKIPIPTPLEVILREYCADRIGVLFLGDYGNYIGSGTFHKRWKNIIKKLTIANNNIPVSDDITAHMFRHTYASDLYKAGVDLKSAQYLLGHKDIKTTLGVYTHFGYVDVKIDCLEKYYETVKKKSEGKIKPLKRTV